MLLIESIKCRQVDGPFVTVAHFDEDAPVDWGPAGNLPRGCDYTQETVVAERYRDRTGRTFEIGMTQEVREVLGLPMEAIQELHQRFEAQEREIWQLRNAMNGYERMGFWKRLQFLFSVGGGPVW